MVSKLPTAANLGTMEEAREHCFDESCCIWQQPQNNCWQHGCMVLCQSRLTGVPSRTARSAEKCRVWIVRILGGDGCYWGWHSSPRSPSCLRLHSIAAT